MKEETIYLLGKVWEHFKKFVPRFGLLIFAYGRFACISLGVSLLIPYALQRYLGLSHDVAMTIMKVLLTITPIFPTAMYAKFKDEDYDNEFSMDLCFAVWVITIVFAWWII